MTKFALLVPFLFVSLFFVTSVRAHEPAFALGEVSLAPHAPRAYLRLLSETIAAEMRTLPSMEKARKFVITARLASLETQRSAPIKSRCVVSLILVARDTGAVFAMAQGTVQVQEAEASRAEAMAVEAAAKSAMKRVFSALRPVSRTAFDVPDLASELIVLARERAVLRRRDPQSASANSLVTRA